MTDPSVAGPPAQGGPDRPIEELARSARGWNGIQLAVLGFVGLCGVLSEADARHPRWLQITAGLLAATALFLACLAVFMVASVAWPLSNQRSTETTDDTDGPAADRTPAARRRLTVGTALTYAAVAVMALAASSNWWPVPEAQSGPSGSTGSAQVEITDTRGNVACGELVEGPAGTISLTTDRGTVELALGGLAALAPATGC